MTIVKKAGLFTPELKARFKVLNVHWEPHSESEWILQYKDYGQFLAYDKVFSTKEKHEQLADKEIEAHIYVLVDDKEIATRKEKRFSYKDGWVTVTGIFEDDIKSYSKHKYNGKYEEYTNYRLNSIFPVEVSELPEGAKIGDWVTVQGEAEIVLPEEGKK